MKRAARSPTGSTIIGTLERITGTAFATVTQNRTGKVQIHYDGETHIDWDSQTTETALTGERLFVDEAQRVWSESELVFEKITTRSRRSRQKE